ncbi:MAG: ABC transporter permease [Sedimentisphaerales bacterium]|nr:ABC transporter permease [Sedimentisphaerales bacterium]
MYKILTITAREYKATVKTKGFIVGLVLAPILMCGSLIAIKISEKTVDVTDKRIAVIDRSGVIAEAIIDAAEQRNENEIVNEEGKKSKPAYVIEVVEPNTEDPMAQRMRLSDRIRTGQLHAFLEIDEGVVHPRKNPQQCRVSYYAKNTVMDDARGWIGWPINNQLRKLRLSDAGIAESDVPDLFSSVYVEGKGLVSMDEKTGQVQPGKRVNEAEQIAPPIISVMLMFLLIMMGASPLISSVMEEKSQRIAEVVLGSVRPFDFMAGKVLGGVAIALTASAVYIVGGILLAMHLDLAEYIPWHLLPWFFTYLILAIVMMGAVFAALGSACNDAKDAQSMTLPAMLPMMIPMFTLVPILKEPEGSFATILSFFPPCTPTVMMMRQATPGGVPAWQPIVGLVCVLVFATLAVWIGGRIFRVAILIQGTPPKWSNLVRWALRG